MEPIIFMLCLTLHNIEESFWLTEWNNINLPNRQRSSVKKHFIFAVIGITALGYLVSGLHLLFPNTIFFEACFIGFVGAMLINAIFPHIVLTLMYQKYCPGVLTACLLILPFSIITLYNAVTTHLKATEVVLFTIIVGAILLVAIPLFEFMAKHLLKDF